MFCARLLISLAGFSGVKQLINFSFQNNNGGVVMARLKEGEAILAIVFGILILAFYNLLPWLVGLYLIISGAASLAKK